MRLYKYLIALLVLLCAGCSANSDTLLKRKDAMVKFVGMDNSTLTLHLENKSDEVMYYTMDGINLNGWYTTPSWEVALDPNTAEDVDIIMEEAIHSLSFDMVVYTTEELLEEKESREYVSLGDSNYEAPLRDSSKDQILLDQEDVLITNMGVEEKDGLTVYLYIRNNKDGVVNFGLDEVKINDQLLDPLVAMEIPAHSQAIVPMRWDAETMATIGKPYAITFYMNGYNQNYSMFYFVEMGAMIWVE